MKNTITVKDKKYQLTLKRLIALILIVTFSFSSITPVYANRLGNYGESSAFSQAVSGAYSGAQASSGGSWGDFFSSIATTIIVEAVNLWYYVNYYNDYGKALISFEIGGTRVDISRGQMVRMVASVAANAMVGLVSSQEYRANWESRVIADIWNQVASLMVTEIFRDILVRRFGMDPNFAGIIAGIISQMLCSLVRGEDIINFIKEVDKAEADAKKAEEQKKEVDQAEADAKKAEEQKTEKPATGQKALMKLSKKSDKDESVADSKDSKGKDKEATISFMIKAQALSGTDAAQAKQNIYNKREVEQGLRHAKVMRDSYKSQLNRVNRNPWQLASNRNKKREELERKLEAAENLVGGLSKLQAQLELKPNDAPVTLTLPQLQAARGYLSSPGKASSQPHLPTKIITNIVIGAHRLINSDRADEEKAVLNPPKGSKGYEFTAERIGPKEDNIITIGTKENPIHLNAGKSTEKIEDGRILKGDNGIDYVAIVEPGKDPMFGPVVREIKLQDGTKLSLPNNEPIRGKFKEGQVFNGSDGRDWRVKGTTPDGSASFEPIPKVIPVKRELPKLEKLPVPGESKTSPQSSALPIKVTPAPLDRDQDWIRREVYDSTVNLSGLESPGMTLQTTYTEVTPNKTRLDPNTAALENASDRTNPTGEAKHTIIDSTPQPVQASPTQNEDMNKLASAVKAEFERVEKLTGERPLSVTVPNADGKQTTIYRESQLNPGK